LSGGEILRFWCSEEERWGRVFCAEEAEEG
jgi:hypothetical protein